jgi:4-hydroxy-tetrahydrodipicolinate reductase
VIRVAVLGAAGRMGGTVCRAVAGEEDLELVAAVDPGAVGRELDAVAGLSGSGLTVAGDVAAVSAAGAEVAVDFTAAASATANLAFLAEHRVHAVCGTTGIAPGDLDRLAALFGPPGANCILAPNFSISAVLLLRFAELAAPYFDAAEVIELHHDEKRDAPSGTAIETARRIGAAKSAARTSFAPDPTTEVVYPGARGGVGPDGVHIHSVRLRGLVAHEEVLFGTLGQSLTIRQDSYDRTSFMPGVLLAIRRVAATAGLTRSLDALLGL